MDYNGIQSLSIEPLSQLIRKNLNGIINLKKYPSLHIHLGFLINYLKIQKTN